MTDTTAGRTVRVWVLCNDSGGGPSLLSFDIELSRSRYDEGDHYELAAEKAEKLGYSDCRCFDQHDPAGLHMLALEAMQSVKEQAEVPGQAADPEWEVPLTLDMTLSATIRVRAGDRAEAISMAREYASTKGYGLFSLDEGNYRGASDFYVGDPAGVQLAEEAGDAGAAPERDR